MKDDEPSELTIKELETEKIQRNERESEEPRDEQQAHRFYMRNKLGSLNIYLEMWWHVWFILLFMAGMIYFIWLVIIPLGWKIWSWAIPLTILIYGGLSFLFFAMARGCVKDIRVGRTKVIGCVNRKWVSHGTGLATGLVKDHNISVKGIRFEVSRRIYDWLLEGDEVCVTYWPHTLKVSRIDRVIPENTRVTGVSQLNL